MSNTSYVRSIIGHARQLSELLSDIAHDSIAHAYLFMGKKHLGKFTVARWFINKILTHGLPEREADAVSMRLKKNMHTDVLILDQLWIDDVCTDWNVISKSSTAPQLHRAKAKVKTDVIGIDDVRALQERLYETPQGSRTCCLIRSIERLHITAANALLKILEEPPPRVLFCFTTESASAIPATIRSRMRLLHFSEASRKELEPLISGLLADDRELLLGMAQGAPGVIFRCLEDAEQLRIERQAHIDARHFLESASMLGRFRKLQEAFEERDSSKLFFRHLFLLLRERLMRENEDDAHCAAETARSLFSILHTFQSNAQKNLLAAHAAFQCASPLSHSPSHSGK